MYLLYAEDEPDLSEAVADILSYHQYTVDTVSDGEEALNYIEAEEYDGIILDIMMPKKSGLEVLTTIRKQGNKTPVLLLTAKSEMEDKITGLDLGADDYLPKPFVMEELLARVRAMLRRRGDYHPDIMTMGNISLNPSSCELSCKGKKFQLSNMEYKLFEVLMNNQGLYLNADQLVIKAWGYDSEADANTIWVYLSNLRKKMKELGSDVKIKTKRNIGYSLVISGEE